MVAGSLLVSMVAGLLEATAGQRATILDDEIYDRYLHTYTHIDRRADKTRQTRPTCEQTREHEDGRMGTHSLDLETTK